MKGKREVLKKIKKVERKMGWMRSLLKENSISPNYRNQLLNKIKAYEGQITGLKWAMK